MFECSRLLHFLLTANYGFPGDFQIVESLTLSFTATPIFIVGRHQAFILVLTFCVYALFHASRKPLSVVKTVFHKQCHKNDLLPKHSCDWKPFDTPEWSQLVGTLEYAFLLCYAIAMFPCGHLAERIDLRLFLSGGMAFSGLTTVVFGLGYYLDIHSFSFYLTVQVFGGIVQATGWPAVITIISNWFGKKRRGLIMGFWNANTNVGNVIGSLIAGIFVNGQWGASFIVPGILMLLVSFLLLFVLVPHPVSDLQLVSSSSSQKLLLEAPVSNAPKIKQTTQLQPGYYSDIKVLSDISTGKEKPISFLAAVHLPNVMAYSFTLFFSKLVSYTFLYWLPNYLANVGVKPLSAEHAAALSTIFDVGGIAGGILAGVFSDHTSTGSGISAQEASTKTTYLRAVTCAGMLLIAAPSLFFYQFGAAEGSTFSHCLLFLCGALITGPCALITTAVSADLGTQPVLQGNSKALATVTAIIDGTGSLGAALGPFLTGMLVPYGWSAVFAMLIAADLVACIISLCIAFRARQTGVGKVMRLGTLNF